MLLSEYHNIIMVYFDKDEEFCGVSNRSLKSGVFLCKVG